jgi:hypothetical protein
MGLVADGGGPGLAAESSPGVVTPERAKALE